MVHRLVRAQRHVRKLWLVIQSSHGRNIDAVLLASREIQQECLSLRDGVPPNPPRARLPRTRMSSRRGPEKQNLRQNLEQHGMPQIALNNRASGGILTALWKS